MFTLEVSKFVYHYYFHHFITILLSETSNEKGFKLDKRSKAAKLLSSSGSYVTSIGIEYEKLVRLTLIQNQTISTLISIIENSKIDSNKNLQNKIESKNLNMNYNDTKIECVCNNNCSTSNTDKSTNIMTNEIENLIQTINTNNIASKSNINSKHTEVNLAKYEDFCEKRYGLQLVDLWAKSEESWCNTNINSKFQSELKCYPYHQEHKKLDGRGPDIFCEATNFFIDFSKVHGSRDGGSKTQAYLSFDQGSLISSCTKTSNYKHGLFMPHHALQMSSFVSDAKLPDSYTTVNIPTYLLARDEDCENSFHSTADFMNIFLVMSALNLDPENQQLMLFDKHPDGPYMELYSKAFSKKYPVIRNDHYGNKIILFKKLIFHLESPAGLIFPKVARPDPLKCFSTSFFQAYRKYILNSFDLYDVVPPSIPTVTLSLRHRTAHKNVGRILANEEEVTNVLREGNMMNLNVVDFAKISYGEQLRIIRNTNVLIGVHGAGLMNIMYAAEEAVLLEIHPSYRQDRHFRHAARMTGKIYMPMRTLIREDCEGSSDNVHIQIGEFRKTVDGAIRLARSFDDGLSECGLICPSEILAIDERLNPHYKSTESKGNAVNLQFPCY